MKPSDIMATLGSSIPAGRLTSVCLRRHSRGQFRRTRPSIAQRMLRLWGTRGGKNTPVNQPQSIR